MKKTKVYFYLCLAVLFNSCIQKHEWVFTVRDHGKKADAFFVKTDFDPINAKVRITGTLNKDAILICTIVNGAPHPNNNDSQYAELSPIKITLPKGKVDVQTGSDLYVRDMHFMYLPQDSTIGDLTIKVSIY